MLKRIHSSWRNKETCLLFFLPLKGAIEGDSPAILSAYLLNLKAPGSVELLMMGIIAMKPFFELGIISVSSQSSMGVEEEKKPDESHEIGGKNKWKLVCAQVARRCGVNVNAKSFRMYR
ncbi:hypothetical protein L6452_13315 [Arctium lappa]|uniref:Uncharacterized protein n=1 Tax=Arctium lappa TaxID=4217 RepID=A0ACB9CI89_ARCLA|nr:hypothetical protein L6452_13315 [Arctium lappa]